MKFYYSSEGIIAYLMRYTRKKDPADECSLKWCVTYKRERRYILTGKTLSGTDWKRFEDAEEGDFKFRTRTADLNDLKIELELYFSRTLKPALDDLKGDFSFDSLMKELDKGDKEIVNDAFRARINELNDSHNVGNASIYQGVLNALMVFAGYRKQRGREKKEIYISDYLARKYIRRGSNVFPVPEIDIPFTEITPSFLKDWEAFLREIETSTSYIGINMRTLRAIINNEGGKPYLTGNKYPYGKGKYVIPTGRRRKTYVPIEDVWKMEKYHTKNLALEQARDLFLFMFYGSGMNFGDLCRLRYRNIQRTMEIRFYREKTAQESGDEPVPVYVPLLPPMIEIINRQGNKEQPGYIFPFLNGIDPRKSNEGQIKKVINAETRRINSSLKIIAGELDIDPDLSTNYARHSYMTHLLSEEFLNDIIVKQMVGHSTNDNVTAGYNHLSAKKRREINEKLLNPKKDYKNVMVKQFNKGKIS